MAKRKQEEFDHEKALAGAERAIERGAGKTLSAADLVRPEVWGFGLEQRKDGFVACRVSNHGRIEYFGPKLATGEQRSESKALALSRAFDAFKEAFAPATKMRFG